MAVSKRTRYEVLRRDNFTCRYCRSSDNPLTVDHVTPVALGGSDKPDNLVAACKDCNAGKSSSLPDAEMLAALTDAQIVYERARATVLARINRDQAKRTRVRREFRKAWSAWDSEMEYIPADWRKSVDMWATRGLTVKRMTEAIDIALGRDFLPARAVYPYMAKVLWNWVSDIDDQIAAEMSGGDA